MTSQPSWLAAVWGSLWADNPLLGRLVVMAILCLTVAAVVAARQHFRRYRRETAMLGRVVERLLERNRGAATSRQPEQDAESPADGGEDGPSPSAASIEPPPTSEPQLADLPTLKEGVDPGSLVWERLSSIETLRAHRARVNLDTLQQLSIARDQAKPGFGLPGFAAGLSMLLGIFGTFFGLAVMVQQIHLGLPTASEGLTLDAWTDSIQNLRAVLGGMKTAFSTSVMGMGGAIACMVIDFRLRRARAAFFERFERFTVEDLLPVTVPAIEDESLLERVTHQLDESFERLESIYAQNRAALADLAGVEEACAQIVGEVRTITRTEAARDLHRVVDQLTETNRSIMGVVEQLPRLVAATERTGREVVTRMEQLLQTGGEGGPTSGPRAAFPRLLVGGAVIALLVMTLVELLK